VVASGLLFTIGFGLDAAVLVHYVTHDFTLPDSSSMIDHLGIIGLLFNDHGILYLLLHLVTARHRSALWRT